MTKENFLLELSKSNFDYPISTFMMYKEKNGNGVGAGKMFENILEWHVNDSVNGWFALEEVSIIDNLLCPKATFL